MNGLLARLRLAHHRVVRDPEVGTSMIEVIVAMILMTICGAIFTGAMVTLFKVHDAAQAVTTSSQQINQAYQSLDKMVRYAAGISDPGLGSGTGDWYVELSDTTSGREVCTQLRLDKATGKLQQRTWNVGTTTPVASGWRALASGLTNAAAVAKSADQPFVVLKPNGSVSRQRLTITLVAQAGPASSPKTSRSSITFSALNSVASPSSPICQQVGRP